MLYRFSKVLLYLVLFSIAVLCVFFFMFLISQFYRVSPLGVEQNEQNNEFVNNTNAMYSIIEKKNLSDTQAAHLYYIKDEQSLYQIIAIILGYSDVIQKYYWDINKADFVFHINDRKVYYADGKMLFLSQLQNKDAYHSVMYTYPLAPISDIYDSIIRSDTNTYVLQRSTDLQNALTHNQDTSYLQTISFLGERITVHALIVEALASIEQRIHTVAKTDTIVQDFLNSVHQISSYSRRKVTKSENISMHSFGLALDFLHTTYDRKVVYWQWSKVIYPNKWNKMPLKNMWLIPDKIVSLFEEHGFIWGGKWANYDTIHFEYRPDIIEYAKIYESLHVQDN